MITASISLPESDGPRHIPKPKQIISTLLILTGVYKTEIAAHAPSEASLQIHQEMGMPGETRLGLIFGTFYLISNLAHQP